MGSPIPQALMFGSSAKGGCGNIFKVLKKLLLNFNEVSGFWAAALWPLGKRITGNGGKAVSLPVHTPGVSVHLGCHSKTLWTGWLVNNRNSFLTVLETECLRSGCSHGWVLVRALFFNKKECHLLIISHMATRWKVIERTPWGPFYKVTKPPSWGLHPHVLVNPRSPTSYYHHIGG